MSNRFTLSIPPAIKEELQVMADGDGRTLSDVVRQCLKIGVTMMKISQSEKTEVILKEFTDENEPGKFEETRVKFVF